MGHQKGSQQISIGVPNQIHHGFSGRFPHSVLSWDIDGVSKVQLKCSETTDYGLLGTSHNSGTNGVLGTHMHQQNDRAPVVLSMNFGLLITFSNLL
jgi:hypothetical protein